MNWPALAQGVKRLTAALAVHRILNASDVGILSEDTLKVVILPLFCCKSQPTRPVFSGNLKSVKHQMYEISGVERCFVSSVSKLPEARV
jgi:hypothetical protein